MARGGADGVPLTMFRIYDKHQCVRVGIVARIVVAADEWTESCRDVCNQHAQPQLQLSGSVASPQVPHLECDVAGFR